MELNEWFVIVNPVSGNGKAKRKWQSIYNELKKQEFKFTYAFTEYEKHSIKLIENAIKHGITKFICVGGDGSLHHIVNGIFHHSDTINIKVIKIGIIPVGTGNDWIKTYGISKNYKKAIEIIKKENIFLQDIGKITLANKNKVVYFNNLAGIGFDAHVVNYVHKFKHLGFIAYLVSTLFSIVNYKRSLLEIKFNNKIIKQSSLLFLIGICKYSGGGMQLTNYISSSDGKFDITYLDKINLVTILKHITKLFNGKVTDLNFVKSYTSSKAFVRVLDTNKTLIQADGEIIGTGDFEVKILPKALQFIIP
ncbi:MAG: diacylglycerol kinase family lipid kinase [Lutibacter sp.]|uniref:diacylglycerol/lipid kinase family protein n=1 Tax=Lutibacter sp. TaxID=1925666 RepID=UPI00299D0034|nr:diacylglycerol kinase family lipid kinase [Lutibacter sp.]MDX1829622.1 diacylglycerol kinase family lipid kinase [Lutibacter sp.]